MAQADVRYEDLFDLYPDGVILVDPDQAVLVEFNEAAHRQLGYTREEYARLRLCDLDASGSVEATHLWMQRVLAQGRDEQETLLQAKSGALRTVQVVAQCFRMGARTLVHCVLRDVTHRSHHERRVTVFSKLGQKLSAAQTTSDAGRTILEAADELLGWDACTLSLSSSTSNTLDLVLAMDRVEGRRTEVKRPTAGIPGPLVSRVLRDGGQLISPQDCAEAPVEGTIFAAAGRPSASALLVPIRCGQRVLGVLSIHSDRPDAYHAQSLDLLQALADYCGGALERIRAETAEREALARLQQAQQVAHLGSWSSELFGSCALNWSSEVFTIFGMPRSGFGATVEDFYERVHPEDRSKVQAAKEAALTLGIPFDVDHRIVRPDGQMRWVHEKAEVVRDPLGAPARMLGIVQDITERKRTEEELRKSEERWKIVFECAPDAYYLHDLQATLLYGNKEAERFIGCAMHEIVGRNLLQLDILDAEGQRLAQAMLARNAQGHATGPTEYRIKRRDAQWIVAEIRTYPVEIDHQTLVLGIARDITERKRAEAELKASEKRYRHVFESVRDAIFVRPATEDSLGRFIEVNRVACERLGYSRDELLQKSPVDIDPGLQKGGLRDEIAKLMVGEAVIFETVHLARNGRRIPVEISSHRVEWDGRDVILSVARDLTERQAAEAGLRDSERRFREMLEDVRLVAVMLDADARVLFANRALLDLTGYSAEETLGQDWFSLFLPTAHATEVRQQFNLVIQGQAQPRYENEIICRNGERRLITWNNTALRDGAGKVVGVSSIGEDITERRLLEEQFRQAQKMEAVGQLAGGVAHDFNNILAATLMHLGLLQQRPQLPRDILEILLEMEHEISRAANLTRQLLLFSRRQVAKYEPVDINAAIWDLLKMLRRLLGENIEVVFQPSSAAAWAKADRGMIEQVVMNLCVNARDAMPRGGVLTLTTNLARRARGFPDDTVGAEPSNFVCLLVRDTGSGIPSSILPHIFEPFFTTKGVGKGTGLGLATVYGIVKQHQGWVEVESAPDAGSSFRVYLPAWLDEPESAPSPDHPGRLRGGSETILLVEDDLSLRRTAALCLRKLGYGVHEAADGTEALQIWEQQQPHIALLLTDLVMPGSTTGLELALRLQQQKPELKVILSSGHSADLLKSDSADWQRFAFLPKPYPAVRLAKVVRQTLDGEPAGSLPDRPEL